MLGLPTFKAIAKDKLSFRYLLSRVRTLWEKEKMLDKELLVNSLHVFQDCVFHCQIQAIRAWFSLELSPI